MSIWLASQMQGSQVEVPANPHAQHSSLHRSWMGYDFMESVWSDGPILQARLVDTVADAIEDVTMDTD